MTRCAGARSRSCWRARCSARPKRAASPVSATSPSSGRSSWSGTTAPTRGGRRPRSGRRCPGGRSGATAFPKARPLPMSGAASTRVIADVRAVDGDVALFAHGHLLRVLTARWLGLPPTEGRLFALDPATISILGHERETPVIRRWNEPRLPLSSPARLLAGSGRRAHLGTSPALRARRQTRDRCGERDGGSDFEPALVAGDELRRKRGSSTPRSPGTRQSRPSRRGQAPSHLAHGVHDAAPTPALSVGTEPIPAAVVGVIVSPMPMPPRRPPGGCSRTSTSHPDARRQQ